MILVSGANGFVGHVLCDMLTEQNFALTGTVRDIRAVTDVHRNISYIPIGSIDDSTDWSNALHGVDCVIHLAAKAHIVNDNSPNPLAEYGKVNAAATERLARQSIEAGVRRFIYVSSIKVNGEKTVETPFSADDPANPQDAYAISKCEAEKKLHELTKDTAMEAVVIRPPLVYGPRVRGNFLRLLHLVDKGVPLPLSSITNKRSMISVFNLCDLFRVCIDHPKAAGEIFLVSDGEDLSTPDLIRSLASAMQRSVHLIPVPVSLLRLSGKMIGRLTDVNRLCDGLQVDINKTRRLLGWTPPFGVDKELTKTVNWYLRAKESGDV